MPLSEVPETYYCITGDQGKAYRRMDDFFKETADWIGIDKTRPFDFQFEVRRAPHIREANGQQIDDFTHMLIYRPRRSHERTVACVAEVRDNWNYVHFSFFRNLQNIVEHENLPENNPASG